MAAVGSWSRPWHRNARRRELEAAPSSATLTAPGAAVAPPNSAAGAESERTEIASVPEPVAGAGEGTIVGTVKWSTGEPLVDVEVRAQTDHSLQHAIRAGRVRTDAQGRYTLRVGVGSWLVLTAFGPGPERARVERERETTVNLVYARGPEVVGVVRDEHGQSVPQAEIWVGSGYGHELPRRLGVADAQGNFRVAVTRERHWLGARARGYRGSPLQMVEASDAKERRLELILVRNDARVRGFVRDPRGQPVADAAVLAVPVGGPGWRARPDGVPVLDATLVTGTTDAQGAFALEGLAPGALRVQAGARGLGVARTEVQVAAGAVGEVTLDLPPAVRVEGSVRDALGRPVARAQVVFANEWPSFALRSAATATDGTYGIDAVSAGDVRVEVRVDARAVLANQLTLTADPVQVWDAVIPAAVELSGRVVDTLQQPLVGYWVAAFRSDNEAGDALANPLGQATTDAQGKFTLANLEAVPLQVRVGIAASSARRGTPPHRADRERRATAAHRPAVDGARRQAAERRRAGARVPSRRRAARTGARAARQLRAGWFRRHRDRRAGRLRLVRLAARQLLGVGASPRLHDAVRRPEGRRCARRRRAR
jgi:protocatechuate 3,4-dioxygenase beta subunit